MRTRVLNFRRNNFFYHLQLPTAEMKMHSQLLRDESRIKAIIINLKAALGGLLFLISFLQLCKRPKLMLKKAI